jgi:hypothetical protein
MMPLRAACRARFERASHAFRARRMALMFDMLGISPSTRVLDVGGTLDLWRFAPHLPRLIFLNQPRAGSEVGDGAKVFGDGLQLPFADHSFDVVVSNSVIEHVGDRDAQAMFAQEIARVGRSYWVQTPHRWFPMEQHLLAPFLHWLPRSLQRRLLAGRITPWEWIARPADPEREYYISHYLGSIYLLDSKAIRQLFPGCRVIVERVLGWPKSLIAYWPGVPDRKRIDPHKLV